MTSWQALRPIELRRSRAVRVVTAAFALVAASAVHLVAAPRGVAAAGPLTFAVLAFAARAWARRQPAALAFEPGGLAAYDRSGALLARGAIAACMHWAGKLLIVSVRPHDGSCAVSFAVAGDALDPEAFRELTVRARQAVHSHL